MIRFFHFLQDMHTYGGSFMYHILDNDQPLVLVGYVVCSEDGV